MAKQAPKKQKSNLSLTRPTYEDKRTEAVTNQSAYNPNFEFKFRTCGPIAAMQMRAPILSNVNRKRLDINDELGGVFDSLSRRLVSAAPRKEIPGFECVGGT